jgi:uncharacterized protein (TIGR00369 family)
MSDQIPMPTPNHHRHLPDATIDERATHCFGCSPLNPQGLQLEFAVDYDALTATAPVRLTQMHEGPPGHIHGGLIATLLDEAMSKLNRPLNAIAMTRNMQIDYLRPSPIEQPLTVSSRHLRREGRKLFHHAELTNAAGDILAQATGLFVIVDPALIKRQFGN